MRVEAGKYNNRLQDCEFIPFALDALTLLSKHFDPVIVVSNQAGIAYGHTTMGDQEDISNWIRDEVYGNGGRILAFYYCPHASDGKCKCRKPGTALFEDARDRYGVDLHNSYVVGDSAADVLASVTIGATPVLVRTGLGEQLLHEVIECPSDYGMLMDANPLVVESLLAFAYWINVKPLTAHAQKATTPPVQAP